MAQAPRYRQAISKAEMEMLCELPKERILAFLEQHYLVKKRGRRIRQSKVLDHLENDTNWPMWKNYV